MWCGKQRGRCGERRDQVRAASQDWLPEAAHVQKAVPTSLRSCATRWSDGYVVRSIHACTVGLDATCPHTAHAPAGSLNAVEPLMLLASMSYDIRVRHVLRTSIRPRCRKPPLVR